MDTSNPWRTTPPRSVVLFLLAVFFIFSSFGFANDVIDMGLKPPFRFAIEVVLSGLFAVCYAASGITMRRKFWIAFVPVFIVQFVCMGLLAHWFPEPPRPAQINAGEFAHLQVRLVFDGLAIILSICLGYAGFVIVSVSEGRRHIRAQTEKTVLEGEMAAAREVQRVIVPENLPTVAGYAIESVYRPASEVGGDFFQVIPLKSGRTLIVIGDVSGKGLRAAMIVSIIVGALRTVSGYTEEPAAILAELNRLLCGRMQEGFATCLAVRLEEQGRLALANAGHLPPYRNGTEIALLGSLPLGLAENAAYEQSNLEMSIGDTIVLLTDGIAEATDDQHVLLGFPRIESMLHAQASAKTVAETAQRHGQNDDMTVLRITRLVE